MKRGGAILAAVLAACVAEPEEKPQDKGLPTDPVPPSFYVLDRDIMAQPVAWEFSVQGKLYEIRLYSEHHPGIDYLIPVVTVDGRAATVKEYYEAMRLYQQRIEAEGDRQSAILSAFYNADRVRADDTLDERVANKKGAILELEKDMDRLSRQIEAEKAVPGEDSEKKISFWIKQLARSHEEWKLKKAELAQLEYQRNLREEMIRTGVGRPQVVPEVEPRARGLQPPPPPPQEPPK
jgi:hypothetical protein